ncbi:unnamed protein product [Angiostrongylus costaricensis]|uniref:Exocyst complex component 5 n=1 Tax=Angiostrongylus costaricensis TaxID=334426 RepID=A0A158PDI8_ANGCS|nr:unnamed protein product [Angiostrongylus costaricensis]
MTGGAETIDDPVSLKNKFEEEIGSLQILSDQFQNKISILEHELNKDKREYVNQLQRLYERNAEAIDKIKQLDATMQTVSTKVVHLGDQLESVHQPRQRAHDALKLIQHFDEFLSDQPLNSMIFTDPDKLLESADLVQKLYSISQELSKEKFQAVQARIAHRYEEVERLLIDEFARAQRDEKKMAEVAKILSEFKGYSHCVDRYVEYIQSLFRTGSDDVYAEALQLVRNHKSKIETIFPSPTAVIQKLILSLYTGRLKEHIYAKLRDSKECGDREGYLVGLAESYSSILRLNKELETLHVSSDALFLSTLTRSLFDRYLSTYQSEELDYLNAQCASILQRFYDSKKHVKKQIQSGGLQELKRDVQARLLTVETYGGETFLSEDVAISILQETKNAFNRASQLCEKLEVPKHSENIFDILLKYLYNDHLNYAVELAIAGISLAEPKVSPPAYFFAVVAQNTTIVLLLMKQYEDSVLPLIKGSVVEQCVAKKWSSSLRSLEQKINVGLERQLNAIVGYVRFILSSEQKKVDFRPENQQINLGASPCQQVVRFLTSQAAAMERGCDGGNLVVLQNELALRLYKLLLHHIQQFVFNSAGAMLLLCDLNEYRKCVSQWRLEANISRQFDSMHALANLLVVLPDNLLDAAHSPMLASLIDATYLLTKFYP